MEREGSLEKPLKKERDNRQAIKRDLLFHAYTITPSTAHTAIVLLESLEPEVLCVTLRAITKFQEQDKENREQMLALGAIEAIIALSGRQEVNVKRFALKALAQLSKLPQGPDEILKAPFHLANICHMLTQSKDVFVTEFATSIIAEVTKEFEGCDQVIQTNILDSVFNKMRNYEDPDVQKNCIQIISNLLDDPVCSDVVSTTPAFNWTSILSLMQNKYPAIQKLAVQTVDKLICRHNDLNLQMSFRASTGIINLVEVLETFEFRDIHSMVLQVLRNSVQTEEGASHLYKTGVLVRVLAYLDVALPDVKPYCLAVLSQLSRTFNGRQAIYDLNIDSLFCSQLLTAGIEVLADSAIGVAFMTKHYDSACRMADTPVVEAISVILSDDGAPWLDVRVNCLQALGDLCKVMPKCAAALIEPKTFESLQNVFRAQTNESDVPIEAKRLALTCCINLLDYLISIEAMTTDKFMKDILKVLEEEDVQLKILVLDLICGLVVNEKGSDIFAKLNGEENMCSLLHVDNVALRTGACRVIQLSVTGETSYKYLPQLPYMIQHKDLRFACPVWETAIEQILKKHPSAKLAYTSALDINDYTKDYFYVMKRLRWSFPILTNLLNVPVTPVQPAFLCNFSDPNETKSSINAIAGDSKSPVSDSTMPLYDPYLRSYLCTLQNCFSNRENLQIDKIDTGVEFRARRLAIYVARQMSGLSIDKDCTNPSVDLHLTDLKITLNTNLIPIGYVRVGGLLERSLLYKVLADRLDIPCGFRRLSSAHAWVEVAIPEPEDRVSDLPREVFPAHYLRANYVVDLMYRPGNLLKIGSVDANNYTGLPHCQPYTLMKNTL